MERSILVESTQVPRHQLLSANSQLRSGLRGPRLISRQNEGRILRDAGNSEFRSENPSANPLLSDLIVGSYSPLLTLLLDVTITCLRVPNESKSCLKFSATNQIVQLFHKQFINSFHTVDVLCNNLSPIASIVFRLFTAW